MVGWDEIDDRHEGGAACRGVVVFHSNFLVTYRANNMEYSLVCYGGKYIA